MQPNHSTLFSYNIAMQLLFSLLFVFFVAADAYGQPALRWGHAFDASSDIAINNMFTDPASNDIVVVGEFTGTADFDPSIGTFNLSSGGTDRFMAKYATDGSFIWAKKMIGLQQPSITIDQNSNIILSGYFVGTVDFDLGAGTTSLSSQGGLDGYIAKYNSNGDFIWVQGVGGPNNDIAGDIAVDPNNGNIYATGTFGFGTSTATSAQNYPGIGFTLNGLRDFWVAKYDTAGSILWMHSGGSRTGVSLNQDDAFALDIDQSGNVYIGGYFHDSLFLSNGGAQTYQVSNSAQNDIFFIRYTSTGNIDWVNVIGSYGVETIFDLKVNDLNNSLYIGGYSYSDSIDFDASPSTQYQNFETLGFIAKYDLTTGLFLWTNNLGTDCSRLSINNNGDIWATGIFSGVVDFDPSSSSFFLSSPSPSNADVYLAQYSSSGAFIEAYSFASTLTLNLEFSNNVLLDSDGSLLFTAKLDGTTDLDLSSTTNNLTTSFPKPFIAKYAPCDLQHTAISFVDNDNHLCNSDTVLLVLNHRDSSSCSYCPSEIYDANNTLFYSTNSLPDTVAFYQKGAFYTKAKGCTTVDTVFQIQQDIVNPQISILPNDTTICAGDSVTLIVTDSCTSCYHSWEQVSPSVTLAFNKLPIRIALEADTMIYEFHSFHSLDCYAIDAITLYRINNRIDSMNLVSPMQPSDPSQNLDLGIAFSPSPPVSAGVFSGPGVSGNTFDPAVSGGGTHYISYSYTESGCTFTETDTIIVIDTTTIGASFTNLNPNSNPYQSSEGCLSDSIEFTFFTSLTTGLSLRFDTIYFSNGQGGYIPVLNYSISRTPTSGGSIVTAKVLVPDGAKTGAVYTSNAVFTGVQINLGNLIINNPDVSFIVGKNPICSNDTIQLTGIPSGGVFSATYSPGGPATGVIVGNELHGPQISSYVSGARDIILKYSYTPSYGGGAGNACTQAILDSTGVTAFDISLNSISFHPVATSETNVPIDSLISVVNPSAARMHTEDFTGAGIGGTTGNYRFYPNILATGTHPISYKITDLVGCTNTITGTIDVIAPPQLTGLSGTQYCTSAGQENITRDPVFPYNSTTTGNTTIEENIMETNIVGGTYNMTTPTPFGPYNGQASQYYIFNPAQATPGQLIFRTTYRRISTTYSNPPTPVITDRHSYIVGSTIDTILIGSGQPVQILDTASVYCEEDVYYKIKLTPNTGTFTIEKIGGGFSTSFVPNAAGEVFINPYQIHQLENTDTDYRMIYSFGAVGCADADTVVFTIPEPADASFATDKYASLPALPSYCKNELPDTLRPTVQGGLFTINGFPSTAQVFKPLGLVANQNHTVIYSIPNSYGCLSQQSDTFRVNGLPPISFDTLLDNSYCVYAGNIPINGIPSGGTFTLYTRNNSQNMGSTFVLAPSSIPGIDTIADTIRVEYTYTDANGCTNQKQMNTIIHPRPKVFMPNLADRYCVDANSSISLSPTPSGGNFFFINQAGNNFNTTTGTYTPAVITAGKDIIAYTYQSPITTCRDTLIDSTEVIGAGTTPMVIQKLDTAGNGVCFLGDTLELRVSPTPSLPDTASFSSSAATPNGGIIFSSTATGIARFVPSQAAEGNIIVTYTYYDQSAGCAASVSDNIVIHPLPKLSMTIGANLDSVCQFTSAKALGAYDNGTPLAMSSVNFWGNGVSNNQFYPDSAAAGTNFIQLSYINSYNCTDTIRDSIKVLINPFPTVTGLNSIYCNSANQDTIFASPGNGTWSPSGAVYLETPPSTSYAIFKPQLAPIGTNTINYTITNFNGCKNTRSKSTLVTGQPTLAFTKPTQSQFCNNDTLHKVRATVNGVVIPYTLADFRVREVASGNFVNRGIVKDSFFDPSAQTGALRLIVEYSDPNSGCVAIDSTPLLVTEAPIAAFAGLNGSRTYCIDNPPVNLDGSNTIATGGIDANNTYYTITGNSNAIVNTTLLDATFYPDSMGGGIDTIVLTVTDLGGCQDTAMAAVRVRALPSGLSISGLDTALCTNQQEVEILGFPQASLNAFYLLNGQDSLLNADTTSEYYLQPNQFGIGNYKLVFKFTDNFSCENSDTNYFRIHPSPTANYQQLNYCYGDTISIVDQSSLDTSFTSSDSLKYWSWEYNGLAYGIGTESFLNLPNQPIGWGNAKLVVFTGTGCTDTITSQSLINGRVGDTIFVYTVPTTSFTTVGGCQGVAIDFKPDSSNLQPLFNQVSFDQLTNVQWIFGDGDTSTINAQNATTIGNFQHTYAQAGIYYPILNATNKTLCKSTDTFRLVISPKVSTYPYAEDFESGTGGWLQSESGADSLWQWGVATGVDINTIANMDNIWATNLAGTYPSDSTAVWVYSPCFDFRYMQRPMFKMNRRSDMLLVDGASIDYFDPATETWKTLGRRDKGINWYNVNSVFGLIGQKQTEGTLIGGSLNGWSGVENSWKDARYRLDELKGMDNIRFRINFGALKSAANSNFDGFAFDDVWIGERTRNTFVEYFSNYNYVDNLTGETILDANQVVYNAIFNNYNGKDVYLLEYHLDAPNNDPINADNPAEHNAREIQYGALSPTNVIVDGNEYNGSYKNLSQNIFDYSMLQDPAFNIDIQSLTIVGNNATVKTTVEANKNITSMAKYIVHVAIMEDTIELAGDTMYNVLRKFLPIHEGNSYTRSWLKGDTVQIQETWAGFSFSTYDTSRLQAIVFVQNDATSEVYQVATTRNLNFSNPCNNCAIGVEQTEANNTEIFDINLYPNPAQDYFQVEFPAALNNDYQWKLWDIRGVELKTGQISKGESLQTIQTRALPSGSYIFGMYDEQQNVYIQRKVIILKP